MENIKDKDELDDRIKKEIDEKEKQGALRDPDYKEKLKNLKIFEPIDVNFRADTVDDNIKQMIGQSPEDIIKKMQLK